MKKTDKFYEQPLRIVMDQIPYSVSKSFWESIYDKSLEEKKKLILEHPETKKLDLEIK